ARRGEPRNQYSKGEARAFQPYVRMPKCRPKVPEFNRVRLITRLPLERTEMHPRTYAACAAALLCLVGLAAPSYGQCQTSTGPDVIVGDIIDSQSYGNVGTIYAFDLGTTSCNIGTQNVQWDGNTNMHPVIGQNLYRLKTVNGAARFEQIGYSWLKHSFTALTQSLCCTCNGQGGPVLG